MAPFDGWATAAVCLTLVAAAQPSATPALLARPAASSASPPVFLTGAAGGVAGHASAGGAVFPIITGCLDQCGETDPACVSECQVCVEANDCKIVDRGCNICMESVKEMRKASQKTTDVIRDSGGTSLVHDGLTAQLDAARRTQLDKERKLIASRDDVLDSQRQAEWAMGERKEAAKRVDEARGAHKEDGAKRERWKVHHDKKVQKLENDQDVKREEQRDAEARLKEARRELKAAEDRLAKQRHRKAHDDVKEAKNKERKLEMEVQEKEKDVKDAEDAEARKREDAAWVDGELQKGAEVGETGVLEAKEELRKARMLERASREQLESSKNRYRRVTAERQRSDRTVTKLEGKLEDNPLPTFVPQERRRLLQRRAEQSAATVSGRWSVLVSTLMAVSLALTM